MQQYRARINRCEPNKKLIRHKTQEAICRLKKELNNQDWSNMYVQDVDVAYENFLSIILTLYNKHCPLVNKTKKTENMANKGDTERMQEKVSVV